MPPQGIHDLWRTVAVKLLSLVIHGQLMQLFQLQVSQNILSPANKKERVAFQNFVKLLEGLLYLILASFKDLRLRSLKLEAILSDN